MDNSAQITIYMAKDLTLKIQWIQLESDWYYDEADVDANDE